MLTILYGRMGETLRSIVTRNDAIAIGSGQVDLVLASPSVAPRHASLARTPDGWVVTGRDTQVNGVMIDGPTIVTTGDQIGIADFVLELRIEEREAIEDGLIANAVRDDASREVYADWLEERGQWDRAELLRLQERAAAVTPIDPAFAEVTTRIRKLANCVDPGWRLKVSRPAVENCLRRELTCTMRWNDLEETADPNTRNCGACKQAVRYCSNETEAVEHARAGHCIVIDIAAATLPLQGLPPRPLPPGRYLPATLPIRTCAVCQATVPPAFRFCGTCGARC